MISIKLPTTVPTAYGFAMPASGAISLGTGRGLASGAAVCATTGDAIRDRHVAPAFPTQGAVPGPTAWSPPIC